MDLSWLEAIVMAAAEQNPAVTGTDIKSITNPEIVFLAIYKYKQYFKFLNLGSQNRDLRSFLGKKYWPNFKSPRAVMIIPVRNVRSTAYSGSRPLSVT